MAGSRRRDRREVHPFVAETWRLSVRALETGLPERYIWIDESGVVSRVGSSPAKPGSQRKHNLWIPPSTGWTALNARAQQLLADVLLLLNLAERGGPRDRDQRLQQTNRTYLPPCLAGGPVPARPEPAARYRRGLRAGLQLQGRVRVQPLPVSTEGGAISQAGT